MDNFEKTEKLRERANVSYEEAKAALEQNNWDLLDAMVALEKAGKTSRPKMEHYSTSYDQQVEYIPVRQKVEEQEKSQPHPGKTIGDAFRSFFRVCRDNFFCINYKSENVIRLPLIAVVILLLFIWKYAIPVMLIALVFGVRYSFEGKDDLKKANDFMDSASAAAQDLKERFKNSENAAREAANRADSANADTVNPDSSNSDSVTADSTNSETV